MVFRDRSGNEFVRAMYWLSLLLLIFGGRLLIDPAGRTTADVVPIYITLAAFEVYAWLLLAIAWWQRSKRQYPDVLRTGTFALVLQGLLYIALNQLYLADAWAGTITGGALLVLAVSKLLLAKRVLRFPMSAPLLAGTAAWLLILAGSGPLLKLAAPDSGAQKLLGWALCWASTALAAYYAVLAAWKRPDSESRPDDERLPWWSAWLIGGVMGGMVILQLISARWAFLVDFSFGFLSPLLAVAAVAGLTLAVATRARRLEAWIGVLLVGGTLLVIGNGTASDKLPAWFHYGHVLSTPLLPTGLFAGALALVVGRKLRSRGLMILGASAMALVGAVRLLQYTWPMLKGATGGMWSKIWSGLDHARRWKYAHGVLLLAGAFLTLGLGVFLQRRRLRRQASGPEETPPGGEAPDAMTPEGGE